MKKYIALLMALVITLSLVSCEKKYEAQPSTEEELKVVMTLSYEGEKYDVKYELYRAFFLTFKEEIDGGNGSVWESDKKDEYISRINEKIISSICDIYSAFHLCDRIGVNVYSSKFNKQIDAYIEQSVASIIASAGKNEEEEISEEEAYKIYLSELKEAGFNYEAHILIYRFELALAAIQDYYMGDFDVEDLNPGKNTGHLEYTRDDVLSYYNSDESARIIEGFKSADINGALEKAEELQKRMSEIAESGDADRMVNLLVSSSTSSADDIKNGILIGKHQLDKMYWGPYTDTAFALGIGEVSDVIFISSETYDGYYVIYKYAKSAEHFEQCYNDIEYSYRQNEISKIREEARSGLAASVEFKDAYSSVVHADIRM